MSLKAYDGMMTKKGFTYLTDSIKENLPKFKEASKNALAKAYAEVIQSHVDGGMSAKTALLYEAQASIDKEQIEKINTTDVTLFSYVFQCAKILSKSYFANDFTVHLNLTIEPVGKKILVYPNILVKEHKEILLTFLTDWYCQNQSDPDEDVPRREWKAREKDWMNFNEVRGLQTQIKILDPTHYWNDLVDEFRGKELVQSILTHIPSYEERKINLLRRKFIDNFSQKNLDEGSSMSDVTRRYFSAIDFIETETGKAELALFSKNTVIDIPLIDEEFILTYKL